LFRERKDEMRRLLFSLAIMALLAAACAPLAQPTEPATATPPPPTATPTPTPAQPVPDVADLTPAQRAALEALRKALGLPADAVTLIGTEAVEWPDSCLGIRYIDALCAQGTVPGYRLIVAAQGQNYEYHTNQDGSLVAPEQPMPASDAAVQAAVQALRTALGLSDETVTVVERTLMEWSDSCLGIAHPAMACLQALTPGWFIRLEAQGREYAYHANADGSLVRSATLALHWHREGGIAGFCDDLFVEWSGAARPQACKLRIAYPEGTLTDAELAQLLDWATRYGTVALTLGDPVGAADAMTVTLSFSGFGEGQPEAAEQQAMTEWAQAVFTRLTGQ